jgi:geranylgeranyl pyrophosphate synthase
MATPAGDVLYPYFARGKMLRASLVFAAATAVDGSRPDDVMMAAAAIELLHGASLIHDDIVDHAATRRGLPALHQQLGVGPALVVGDHLLLLAFAALGEARACHPPGRVLDALDTLNALARDCCRGQFDELRAGRWMTEQAYLAVVRGKTGAPFVAAGVLGAVLGGGTPSEIAHIRAFAQELGVAYQIGDDLLDLLGDPNMLGKPVGNSLALGRAMLPLIYLGQARAEALRTSVGEAAAMPSASAAATDERRRGLAQLLQREGILDRVRRVQQAHVDAAFIAADNLSNTAGVDALHGLASRAIPVLPS